MEHIHDEIERCDVTEEHEGVISRVRAEMPADETLYALSELFKIFGDSTRIRILYALFEAEMCVRDIAELLNITQSAISHQLRLLKQSKLVKNRRDGKTVYYSLADDARFDDILKQAIAAIKKVDGNVEVIVK